MVPPNLRYAPERLQGRMRTKRSPFLTYAPGGQGDDDRGLGRGRHAACASQTDMETIGCMSLTCSSVDGSTTLPTSAVLFICNGLHPFHGLSIEAFLDGDVCHGVGGRSAMPVLLAG